MAHQTDLLTLASQWRLRAAQARELAAEGAARALEICANELEQSLRLYDEQFLTLADASRECGFSADHLGRLVRNGTLTNFGRRNAPRIRRGELPQRASARASRCLTKTPTPVLSAVQVARSVVNRHAGGADD
jgi:hypothetical protein